MEAKNRGNQTPRNTGLLEEKKSGEGGPRRELAKKKNLKTRGGGGGGRRNGEMRGEENENCPNEGRKHACVRAIVLLAEADQKGKLEEGRVSVCKQKLLLESVIQAEMNLRRLILDL